MRNKFLLAGAALAVMVPSIASAQSSSCERQRSGRVAATVGGGAVGALAGSAIAGRGDRTEGAIIGGVLGAIAGNQLAKPDQSCSRAYGWYDKQGRWHATGVSANSARGYFDRNGDWVEGRPGGYYDGDRWIASSNANGDNGYTDSNGYWVPVGTQGYYDRDGRWMSGSQSGYYDSRGRWVAGPVQGRYDANGRWVAGDPGYSNSGNWSSQEQPGYWDTNGRWRAGRVQGYYDSRGRWVSTSGNMGGSANGNWNGNNNSYDFSRAPSGLEDRIEWLRGYIREERRDLNRNDRQYARSELGAIESQHRMFANSGGRLTVREESQVRLRLDRLTRRLDMARRQAMR